MAVARWSPYLFTGDLDLYLDAAVSSVFALTIGEGTGQGSSLRMVKYGIPRAAELTTGCITSNPFHYHSYLKKQEELGQLRIVNTLIGPER